MTSTEQRPFYSVAEFLSNWGRESEVPQDLTVAAVLGRPIGHSKSPQLHSAAAQALGLDGFHYVRVEAGSAEELHQLLRQSHPQVAGFSVTMPGKTAALEVADVITERAERIGSANTLVRQADGQWMADNTDVVGVLRCLEKLKSEGVSMARTSAVIVGNGGTARPAVAALAAMGITAVTVLARSDRALHLQELITSYGMSFQWHTFDSEKMPATCRGASVLINTIPADIAARHAQIFASAQGIVDVIYDPYPTDLMVAAKESGTAVSDGLTMLAGQAEEQFRYFSGHAAPAGVMLKAVR